MDRDEALNLLLRFFRLDPPFEEGRSCVGHASSQIPGIFFKWFSGLSKESQAVIMTVLFEEVLEGHALPDLGGASALLVSTVAKRPALFRRNC